VVAFLASLAVVLAADQALKAAAFNLAEAESGFVYRENPDGGFAALPPWAGGLVLLVAAACMYALGASEEWPALMSIGLGAALGGAASNFIDRLRFGYVVDYVGLPNGAALNLGDAAIATGTVLAVLGYLLELSS